MERLSLNEGEELDFGDDGEKEVNTAQALCLVGHFLTDREIRVPVMNDRMADVWRPGRGVLITEVEEGLFLFQFYHQLDI